MLRRIVFIIFFWPTLLFAENITENWQDILNKANGQTVHWFAWGGSSTYNDYIAWVVKQVEPYGITLKHVPIADTANAVRRVITEKEANRNDNGSVDLIWINGENFRAMKDADLLQDKFLYNLPNAKYLNLKDNKNLLEDFSVPTDGLESPWGLARIVIAHDSKRHDNPPSSAIDLKDYLQKHKGKFTYPAPPDFSGTAFLKQLLLELAYANGVDLDVFNSPPDANTQTELLKPLWQYLEEIHPLLWAQGRDFPTNATNLEQMLDSGEINAAFFYNPGVASQGIKTGRLPDTTEVIFPKLGSISNAHFVTIPFNSPNKEGAMVVANFLMSPQAQARKSNPEIWGELTVLDMDMLSEKYISLFSSFNSFLGTPDYSQVTPAWKEPNVEWLEIIESGWLKRFGK